MLFFLCCLFAFILIRYLFVSSCDLRYTYKDSNLVAFFCFHHGNGIPGVVHCRALLSMRTQNVSFLLLLLSHFLLEFLIVFPVFLGTHVLFLLSFFTDLNIRIFKSVKKD